MSERTVDPGNKKVADLHRKRAAERAARIEEAKRRKEAKKRKKQR